jgi:hypothetical protein
MFLHRLALAIGWPSATSLGRRISAKSLFEWEAFDELEPFGELRDDYRTALVAQMIFNTQVIEKHRRPLPDFLLKWGAATATNEDERPPAPRKQTVEEQIQAIHIWAGVLSSPHVKEVDG